MGIGGAALDLYLSSEVFQIKKKKQTGENKRRKENRNPGAFSTCLTLGHYSASSGEGLPAAFSPSWVVKQRHVLVSPGCAASGFSISKSHVPLLPSRTDPLGSRWAAPRSSRASP